MGPPRPRYRLTTFAVTPFAETTEAMRRVKGRLQRERVTADVDTGVKGVRMHLFAWSAQMLEKQRLPEDAMVCMALSPK